MIKKLLIIGVVFSLLIFSACDIAQSPDNSSSKTDSLHQSLENSSSSSTIVDDSIWDDSILEGSVPENLNTSDLSGMDFEFSKRDSQNDYKQKDVRTPEDKGDYFDISSEGVYVFTGDITDKMICVNASEKDKIQIVLDNASLSYSKGPCINIQSADKVFITLTDNSINYVSDGTNRDDETQDGAIFSRADLAINGNGKLTVKGNFKHGILSKDDLIIANAALDITANNVGLSGKDCVKITNADISVSAGSDGIRSDNAEDSTRGFVYIESGKINITAANDGIQAETAVKISDGDINIFSGKGSSQPLKNASDSYKGIKAVSDIIIENGYINIDSTDDCLHSNNTIVISGGCLNLASGDDGIHSDNDLAISSGNITVSKSYEGLESSRIFISGGNVDITASDDGLNAAGGNDQSSMGGRPGMGGFDNGIGEINISGGYLLVDASGDGIDSNGTLVISRGIVLVSGPTNNGNGALDYGRSATVTGGTLIALGSSGMATGFTKAENQAAILYNFTSQSAETPFALCDENGNAILSFNPKKGYSSAVITSPDIKQGENYKIIVGGNISNADKNGFSQNQPMDGGNIVAEFTVDSAVYNVGGFGGGFGGHGGQKPPDGFGGGMTPPDGFGDGKNPPEGFDGSMTPPPIP